MRPEPGAPVLPAEVDADGAGLQVLPAQGAPGAAGPGAGLVTAGGQVWLRRGLRGG